MAHLVSLYLTTSVNLNQLDKLLIIITPTSSMISEPLLLHIPRNIFSLIGKSEIARKYGMTKMNHAQKQTVKKNVANVPQKCCHQR